MSGHAEGFDGPAPPSGAPCPASTGWSPTGHRVRLAERQVGLLSNHASQTHTGRPASEALSRRLREAGGYELQLFSPEHGFELGAAAGQSVGHGTDPLTGLSVQSLYGAGDDDPAAFDDIDTLVIDLRDVGVRCYTYAATAARAARRALERISRSSSATARTRSARPPKARARTPSCGHSSPSSTCRLSMATPSASCSRAMWRRPSARPRSSSIPPISCSTPTSAGRRPRRASPPPTPSRPMPGWSCWKPPTSARAGAPRSRFAASPRRGSTMPRCRTP